MVGTVSFEDLQVAYLIDPMVSISHILEKLCIHLARTDSKSREVPTEPTGNDPPVSYLVWTIGSSRDPSAACWIRRRDAKGIPLASKVTGAHAHDVTHVIPLVDEVPLVRGEKKQAKTKTRHGARGSRLGL